MELPPKALFALIDIKKELLSRVAVEEVQPAQKRLEDAAPARTFRQRHARSSGAYQRGCQSHKFWSPVH